MSKNEYVFFIEYFTFFIGYDVHGDLEYMHKLSPLFAK